ncbi:hypothetical protein FKP32DRAFT_1191096 [Trametes sanguinea]|nr:hypothetical protein FKP32DRAFT_1191096 [Trametes sanguinea]
MAQFSFLRAEILVLFVESLLSGVHSILYTISVWILLYRRRRGRRSRSSFNWWMFVVVTTMYILAIAHLIVDMLHIMTAFVDHWSDPGGPLAYYGHEGVVPSYLAAPVFFALLTLEGDCFMAYRIFIVWRRELKSLVLPLLLIAGDVVAAAITGFELCKNPESDPNGLLAPSIYGPLIAYFVMTLVTNIVLSLLLLGRLMWHDREMRRAFGAHDAASRAHWQVMKTIIQSEAIYSIGVIVNLVLYIVRSNAVFITFAALPALVGISFTMIIARIGLSDALDDSSGASHSSELSTLRAADPSREPGQSVSASDALACTGDVPVPNLIKVSLSRAGDLESKASREELDKVSGELGGEAMQLCTMRPASGGCSV